MSRNTLFSWIELVLSFIGALVAGSIYFAHRQNIDLPCVTGSGCELVQASHWSHIGTLPVALLGFFGYAGLCILSTLKLTVDLQPASKIRLLMLLISAGGFAYSWYLQYVSHVFIGAICAWCMTSAIIMTLIFFTIAIDTFGDKP